MRLSIFRLPGLAAADLTLLLTAAAGFATFFFVSLYLQQIIGYSPLRAGAAFLPFSAGIATGATVARQLVPRPRRPRPHQPTGTPDQHIRQSLNHSASSVISDHGWIPAAAVSDMWEPRACRKKTNP